MNSFIFDKLSRFFPESVLHKIIESIDDPFLINEKRYAVVMFADISGFTSISERLSAEEVTYMMNTIFSLLGNTVRKHNGIIDKFLGDCILSIFGVTDGNEPEKDACECALEMLTVTASLKENFKLHYDFDINLSIGINAGELVIGTIGYNDRMEYTVIGDTVNTASRIQHAASPGEIFISESVYARVRKFFCIDDAGSREMKNKKIPVKLYTLHGFQKEERSTTHNNVFIGRDREFEILKKTFYSSDNALKSILLHGDSGIGKSSLLRKFYNEIYTGVNVYCDLIEPERNYQSCAAAPVKNVLINRKVHDENSPSLRLTCRAISFY